MLKMWSHVGLNKEEKTGVKLPSLRQGRATARPRARHPRVLGGTPLGFHAVFPTFYLKKLRYLLPLSLIVILGKVSSKTGFMMRIES